MAYSHLYRSMSTPNITDTENGQRSPLVSVVVPVYNVEQYLRQCLDSICNQTYGSLEIICVDDGSTDNSPQILKEYQDRDSRIKIVTQSNAGLAAARNAALDCATGEFISGVDSDDFLSPGFYETGMRYMEADVDVVELCLQPFGKDEKLVKELDNFYKRKEKEKVIVDGRSINKFTFTFMNKIYRRSILERYHIRFPKGLWYEDVPFSRSYLSMCRSAYLLTDRLYNYRIREDSIMGQTRRSRKSDRCLDIVPSVETVFLFYKQHDIWERMLPCIEKLGNHVHWAALKPLPEEKRLAGELIYRKFVRKWGLSMLFPNNQLFCHYGRAKGVDIVQKYVDERIASLQKEMQKLRDARTSVRGQDTEIDSTLICRYKVLKYIPVVTMQTSCNPQTGCIKKQIKVFGFIPLIKGRGSQYHMHWLLFNFLPVGRTERVQ